MSRKQTAKAKTSATVKKQGAAAASPELKQAEPPRLIISHDGRVFKATPDATYWKLEEGGAFFDYYTFSDEENAFAATALFGQARDTAWIRSVRAGHHDILSVNGETMHVHCDPVTMPDGRSFLIISNVEMTEQNDETQLKNWLTGKVGAETVNNVRLTSPNEIQPFLDMAHDLMAVCSSSGQFQKVNNTFAAVLGYNGHEEELRELHFVDIIAPEDRAQVRTIFRDMTSGDAMPTLLVDFEARTLDRRGGGHWVEWRFKRVNGLFYMVGHDLTTIKEHEQALLKNQQRLSEAQSIGHMGNWSWRVGEDNIDFSEEIYRIFGVETDSFQPSIYTINRMLHRRDSGRMMQAFQRAIFEKREYDLEFRIVRPDGDTRFVRCQGRCELDDEGDVMSLFGIMQDITARTHYERDLKEAKEAAERAYAAKSQFLANMSHELRTPLNAIIGFSEMMQRQMLGPIGTERYLDYINGIRDSGSHLLDLISDILDMSKIEAGKYKLDLETFNVYKSIRLAAHMMEGRALDGVIKLVLDLPPESDDDVKIIADRRAVTQTILNVLSNAVKFTEPGGQVTISANVPHGSAYITITIEDTGIGIPAHKLSCITNPFEQASNHFTRRHEGTGLGLAITKDLAEMHGGDLRFESTIGKGTKVQLILPLDCTEKRRDLDQD